MLSKMYVCDLEHITCFFKLTQKKESYCNAFHWNIFDKWHCTLLPITQKVSLCYTYKQQLFVDSLLLLCQTSAVVLVFQWVSVCLCLSDSQLALSFMEYLWNLEPSSFWHLLWITKLPYLIILSEHENFNLKWRRKCQKCLVQLISTI